jgi:hypothetical protein
MRQLGDDVGRRWSHEQEVRTIGQFDVSRLPSFLLIIQVANDRVTRHCFERQGGDEPEGIPGHDDVHRVSGPRQQARKIDCLVSGY